MIGDVFRAAAIIDFYTSELIDFKKLICKKMT
jgi:hypothetical protein